MYADGDDPLHATVINDLFTDPLIPPTVETLRGRKRKNRIELQSIVAPTVQITRTVICPLFNTQGHTRGTCVRRNSAPTKDYIFERLNCIL